MQTVPERQRFWVPVAPGRSLCGAAGDGLLHRPRPTGHEPEELVRSTTLMPKTRKDEDRDRPQPSRLLAMTIISSPKIRVSSTRRHREGRRDPGAAETTRRGRGHVRHDPPSPDGKHGAVGSGTRTRPTAPPPAPCAPRTPARRLPDPRPRQAPSAPVWRGGARRAPKRPPGGDMHAGRKAEGGPSRVPMGFWNLEVEDYFIFIQI